MKLWLLVLAFASLMATSLPGDPSGAQVPQDRAQLCPVMLTSFLQSGPVYIAVLKPEDEAADYAGSLTFFSAKNAYEVSFKNLHQHTLAFTLPVQDELLYGSMDTAGKTGQPVTSCASFIIGRGPGGGPAPAGATVATLRGPLPGLPCGKMLEEAQMIHGSAPNMYAPVKKADVVVKIYIDSEGHGFGASILQSGGDPALDGLAIQSARQAKYRPRQFLCTPVIGVYSFRLHYAWRP